MTDNPPPAAVLAYQSSHGIEPSSPSTSIIVICWIIIIAIVGLEATANFERASTAANSLADNATLSAIGHCIIGAHALTAAAGAKSGQADPIAPLVVEMESVVKTPADRLRLAIIAKEVQSPAAADARLTALAKAKDLSAPLQSDLKTLRIIYRDGPAAVSATQRQSLLDHEGWFGKVALSFGLPDNNPERNKLLTEAKRAFVVSSGAAVAGGGGLLLGAGLIVLAIVLASVGRLPLRFRPGGRDSVFLEAFSVYLAGFVLISLLLHALIKSPGLGWTLVLTIVLPVAVLWPVYRGKPWSQTRMEIGWHRGAGFITEIACGIVGYLAALPLLAIMLLITLQLIRLSGTTPSHPVVNYLGGGTGEIVLIYFIACVWAPIFEETMFRGALFNHLRAGHGWWISAGIVGLLFACVHPQGWTTIPILGGIGMVLCALREWRGTLIASIAAHALNNGTVITLALLTSR